MLHLQAQWDLWTGGTLIVGIDEEKRRVYVGHRGKAIYFDEPDEVVAEGIRVWNGAIGHVSIPREILEKLILKQEQPDD